MNILKQIPGPINAFIYNYINMLVIRSGYVVCYLCYR